MLCGMETITTLRQMPGRPEDLAIVEDGAALTVVWPSRTCVIAADVLWRQCPSAAGKRRRIDGRDTPPPGIAITRLAPIGGYGVNIAFCDGHDRGIYPWGLLAELADKPAVEDFLLPKTA